ncbi:hypothetical protein [Nocardia ignorata]|uniref:Uncharacterized protein n=1 Tax=Nocardia ignorata TaxID=145285 RepID=A0A4R6NZT9_NOCIG|nr:hypothetical protein [Nocardia ignorata]TDP29837.1 hypothetical protein DFR75_112105 [Nocardia ignorata]
MATDDHDNEIRVGDRVRVIRDFDPPHPTGGIRHVEFEGTLREVDRIGFRLDGEWPYCGHYSWNPGPTITQTVTRL